MTEAVFRVVRRRAKPGCALAYEELIRAMFAAASHFPGYLAAELIPPATPDAEYQIIQRFASADDLERWNRSEERATWLERLQTVAHGAPEYRLLTGLDAWFAPPAVPIATPPKRWRMTVVSWLGIFPTVTALLVLFSPLIAPLPFPLRTALFTMLVAVLMSYIVMPRLTSWMAWWLRR
jgi:antibiotic biosynthesis monooxygenase (ABM) superfamily enzyme